MLNYSDAFPKTPVVTISTRMAPSSKYWHPGVNIATGLTTSTGFTAV
jgi:hypothetical protein